jgi:hypothetical protein
LLLRSLRIQEGQEEILLGGAERTRGKKLVVWKQVNVIAI